MASCNGACVCLLLATVSPVYGLSLMGPIKDHNATRATDQLTDLVAALTPVLRSLTPVLDSLAPALQRLGPILDKLLGSLTTPFNVTAANPPETPLDLIIQKLLGPKGLITGLLGGPSGNASSPLDSLVQGLGTVVVGVGSSAGGRQIQDTLDGLAGGLVSTNGAAVSGVSNASRGKLTKQLDGLVRSVRPMAGQAIRGTSSVSAGQLTDQLGGVVGGLPSLVGEAVRGASTVSNRRLAANIGGFVRDINTTLEQALRKTNKLTDASVSSILRNNASTVGTARDGQEQLKISAVLSKELIDKNKSRSVEMKPGIVESVSSSLPDGVPMTWNFWTLGSHARTAHHLSESCESMCPQVYRPVCSSAGSTYDNPCIMGCSGEEMKCVGPCPCRSSVHPAIRHCGCDPEDYNPVCTVSGHTLTNTCIAACLKQRIACSSTCPC